MSFKLVAPQKILHNSGYIVQGLDRFHIEYIDNKKILVIPVEDRAEPKYEIYWNKITGWEPPFDSEKITDFEMDLIRSNVKLALDFHAI